MKQLFQLNTPPVIREFHGEHFFLSNFYPSPFRAEGCMWPTNEHFYQAMKVTPRVHDGDTCVCRMVTPNFAKRWGRTAKLRPDWEEVKLDVMRRGLKFKFVTHDDLREKLLATGDAQLVEGNWWGDRFWGVSEGRGENWLGRLLMELRSELRAA